MKRKISVILAATVLLVMSFAGGMLVQYHRTSVTVQEVSPSAQTNQEIVSSGGSKVVIDYPPNQCIVNFTSDKLLAPNFYIGYGDVGSALDLSFFDKKEYNPKEVADIINNFDVNSVS